MYKQEELEAMSNFELNKLAAKYFLPCDYVFDEDKQVVSLANYQDVMASYDMHDQVLVPYSEYNPCYYWRDCGALIDEVKINTVMGNSLAAAISVIGCTPIQVADESVKRAVVIVYILIKQGAGYVG